MKTMNNNTNYLFYRKYFDFEANNLKRADCINQIIKFNSNLSDQEQRSLRANLNDHRNTDAELNKRRNIEELKFINNSILNCPLEKIDIDECSNSDFLLQTIYPGLLMGTGYSHDYKAENEDTTQEGFKIGFYFDYTTGMPVIPGSSVKGVLRSCFPQRVVKSKNGKNKKPKYPEQKEEFIRQELKALGINEENIHIDILEREIFDGLRPLKDEKGKIIFKPFSIYKRDTFFEAIPTKINNTKKVLFEDDTLAVHGENLLKNPVPIKFLKVAPGVQYQFNFKLFDSVVYPDITAEKKLQLFKEILLTIGVGAKTNVGYGQFKQTNS